MKPDEIGDLHLVLPRNASGEAKLVIQLVATDGAIIADTAMVLKMTAYSTADIGASHTKTEPTQAPVIEELAEARAGQPALRSAREPRRRNGNARRSNAITA